MPGMSAKKTKPKAINKAFIPPNPTTKKMIEITPNIIQRIIRKTFSAFAEPDFPMYLSR